jgi:hypothetical protein
MNNFVTAGHANAWDIGAECCLASIQDDANIRHHKKVETKIL